MRYDVSVIGLGRIGLPLALSFADRGLSVLGVDSDLDRLSSIAERRMPFKEPGTDELIGRVELGLSSRAADAAQADAIVPSIAAAANHFLIMCWISDEKRPAAADRETQSIDATLPFKPGQIANAHSGRRLPARSGTVRRNRPRAASSDRPA